MKRSDENRVVRITFIAEDAAAVDNVLNEVGALATERGCNFILSETDIPTATDIKAAEELEIYDDTRG